MQSVIDTPSIAKNVNFPVSSSCVADFLVPENMKRVVDTDGVPLNGIVLHVGRNEPGSNRADPIRLIGPPKPGALGAAIARRDRKAANHQLRVIADHGVQVKKVASLRDNTLSRSERNVEFSLFSTLSLDDELARRNCDRVVLYNPGKGTIKRLADMKLKFDTEIDTVDREYFDEIDCICRELHCPRPIRFSKPECDVLYYSAFSNPAVLKGCNKLCFQINPGRVGFYNKGLINTTYPSERDGVHGYDYSVYKGNYENKCRYFGSTSDTIYNSDVLENYFSFNSPISSRNVIGYSVQDVIYHDLWTTSPIVALHRVKMPVVSSRMCPLDAQYLVADNVCVGPTGEITAQLGDGQTRCVYDGKTYRSGYELRRFPSFKRSTANHISSFTDNYSVHSRATVMISPYTGYVSLLGQKFRLTKKDGRYKLNSVFSARGPFVVESPDGEFKVDGKCYTEVKDVPLINSVADWVNMNLTAENYRDSMVYTKLKVIEELEEDVFTVSSQVT